LRRILSKNTVKHNLKVSQANRRQIFESIKILRSAR
jgi:hypothetical protein